MSQHTPIGLKNETQIIKALTHSGNFHADETMGYVILHYACSPQGDLRKRILSSHIDGDRLTFTRSRSPQVIEKADIVFDVGGIYNPAEGRYDHHMRNKPIRDNGIPYSAAGLLWKDYGLTAVRNLVQTPVDEETILQIWEAIDQSLITPIDQDDNGVAKMGKLSLADIVSACSPPWDTAELYGEDEALKKENLGFANAATAVAAHLVNTVDRIRASLKATNRVIEAYQQAEDKRILIMDTGMPTAKVIFDRDLPVVYVVSPSGKQWNVKAIPPTKGDFGQRVPLPESWAGLERNELARISGVKDAVFAHPARFICGAESKEGAIRMAQLSLQIFDTLKGKK
ncbi:MYG1 family protein [Swingsia samuiensis]|uniref:MYG1 family protein n=1 Tax=Swingsia samuiensis TaxID=1293412 RepID=A0A4Y6UJL9_9PROT|nr:MYG1 family protein [Swingsia samuiensis]QDH16666.1 MYG1 family protein [Swingsia samuiensis]